MFRFTLFCVVTLCVSLVWLTHMPMLFAQVMQSGSFKMQSDSINFAGGLSSSTNFVQESTVGELATGASQSTNYRLRAGYQQMQEVYLALSGATDVVLAPSIPGVTGGTSNGSTTLTVTTDSPSGYTLTIVAAQSPAMVGPFSATIADYVPLGDPDYSFSVSPTQSRFGYTPEGVDTVSRFKDNGALCNTGTQNSVATCWDGLTTVATTIAQRTSPNHPQGSTTTIRFRVGVGGSVSQTPGLYVATTTVTALPL
jgi:hypothetical protein